MPRLLFSFLLLLACLSGSVAGLAQPGADMPARPTPFRFVTDEGQMLSAADAQKLESGLRRYADNTGTQLVVVTVPTLGGRPIADYGRALGATWGIGQRDKNNGIVVLLAAQERQVTIQAGSGLRSQITPALTARVINEQMMPGFKQGRYFAGLRAGLNTLMLAANPESAPLQNPAASAATAEEAGAAGSAAPASSDPSASTAPLDMDQPAMAAEPAAEPFNPNSTPSGAGDMSPSSAPGLGGGALLLGAVVLGGGIWLLVRLFRRRTTAAGPAVGPQAGSTPNFYPNQPNQPSGQAGYGPGYGSRQSAPDFLPNRSGSGSGMGGVLLTGAAAAAGAYIGNRMAHGQSHPDGAPLPPDTPAPNLDAGAAAGAAGSGGFPFLNDSAPADGPAPDYFSDSAESAPDYFSSDATSYDDPSSGDSGGGGFDDDNSNSGSW